MQKERHSRRKRDRIRLDDDCGFIEYFVDAAGVPWEEISTVAIGLQSAKSRSENTLSQRLSNLIPSTSNIHYVSHHLAHAWTAVGTAQCSTADVLVIDGMGSPSIDCQDECKEAKLVTGDLGGSEALSLYRLENGKLLCEQKSLASHWLGPRRGRQLREFRTLGGMYSAVADLIFGDVFAAGKVMALADLGQPTFAVEDFLRVHLGEVQFSNEVGSFDFGNVFSWADPLAKDLAASVQRALEVAIEQFLESHAILQNKERPLLLSGGVAMNGLVNQKIAKTGKVIYVPSVTEDSGIALGAALYAESLSPHSTNRQLGASDIRFTGSDISDSKENDVQDFSGHQSIEAYPHNSMTDVAKAAAEVISKEGLVGWCQGRSEFGPRALGNRSILADPRNSKIKSLLNLKVKKREGFRPFAAAILEDQAEDWFDILGTNRTYADMLSVAKVREDRGAWIPAVLHSDDTSRVQLVSESSNPDFHLLLAEFFELTGIPLLLNTSLNVNSEPLVEHPIQAIQLGCTTPLQTLYIGLSEYKFKTTECSTVASQRYSREEDPYPKW